MQKLFIITLFALVACTLSAPAPEIDDEASEFALFEDDAKETGSLGDKQIFADFCIDARDEIKSYLKGSLNGGASKIFNIIAESVASVAARVGEANNAAIAEGNKAISEDMRNAKHAVKGVAQSTYQTTFDEIKSRLQNMKASLNGETVKEMVQDACTEISLSLKPMIEKKLTAAKRDLSSATSDPATQALIKGVRVENVGCLSTGRLVKVARGCDILKMLAPTLLDAFGY